MKVYHGSYMSIEHIDLSKCEKRRDFGQGFYVTNILEQAQFWAKRKGIANKTKGFVTEFDFDEEAFEDDDLHVLRFDEYNEAWLDFVVSNRRKGSKAHAYDIIEGPVADDDITQRIDAYLEGVISKTDFLKELKFHRPTHQIALCTIESLQMLEHIKKKKYVGNIDDTITQSLAVDYGMTVNQAIDVYFESKTYKQLIDEKTELCNKSWEEIYKLLLTELNLRLT
ncbi:MAG: hypothetical protein EZS26_000623 [Candidatus Ordinivivax streblomastigis]|uniref:DUF3990 domain-containing protein n=1 Tax=Candidatus Ordinivivax streblomastigis TaxID=2540710 RepID=A0A5M8P452_9BACT|nr:MAG: hypothetical protein EZS26_000623 [Candidatus Ordinivivax streblomastigis]